MLPPGPLVDAPTLAAAAGEPGVILADVRWYLDGRSAAEAFELGHIPGAVRVDLDTVLAGPPGGSAGRHPLPDPSAFATSLGALGIDDESLVIAYDDAGGTIAARLWWMLRSVGQRCAVLDGGLDAWTGPLAQGAGHPRRPVSRRSVPWPAELVATTEEVEGLAAGRIDAVLLDARAAARYAGEVEPIDRRAGHIPGARHAPASGNLGPSGRFLPPDALRTRYLELVGDADATVVASCGSGVTACHDLLAMEIAGLPPGRLYVGSWSAWSSSDQRPLATGTDPG